MHDQSPLCRVVMGAYPQPALPPFPKGEAASGHIHGQAPNLCRWLILVIVGLCLLNPTSPALAHRVLVYAYADGDLIHTESKFVGSGAVQQGAVQILDQKTGKILLGGQTDDQGKFSFKIPAEAAAQRSDLLIAVEASMGHRGEWQLKAESYLSGAESASASAPSAPSAPPAAAAPPPTVPAGTGTPALDRQVLEETLNNALERQLAPVKEMLAGSQVHKTTLSDIVGGLGYIMGIFGLLAYFKSKQKRN